MVKTEVREKLPGAFASAADGIRKALEYLKGRGVTSDRLLPYGLQLVMLGEFFRQCPRPPSSVVELLDRWFWVTSFTGWFGGVNTAQAELALSEIRSLATGTGIGFSVVDLEAPAQPFPERFDGRSARVRAFLLYLASLRPRSLRGEEDLNPGELLSTLGTGAVGYVFSNHPDRRDLVRSPANRMFLDRAHVGQAFGALRAMRDDVLTTVLATHGFSTDSIHRLRSDDRTGLVESRLQTLISGEREFMKGRNVTLPSAQTAATIADSDVSDDEYSEIELGDTDG